MADVQKQAARYISQGLTGCQRILKLPRNTVVTVNNKSFKLLEESYVTGTANDFVVAFEALTPKV